MDKNCCGGKIVDILDLRKFLKLISDTNRLRILCLLTKKELCVCRIFEALRLSQNLVSHHLAKLKEAGILDERKEGTFVIYSVNRKSLKRYKKIFNLIIKD